MKKIKKSITIILLLMMIISTQNIFAAEEVFDPFKGEIVLTQSVVNLKYEDNEIGGNFEGIHETSLESSIFGPWQQLLSKTNNEYTVHEDNLLRNIMDRGNLFRNTEYTYYGYSIWYKDGTKELGYEKKLTYEDLHKLEVNPENPEEIIRRINQVLVYYGPKSKMTINYNLVNSDGTKTLLKSDVSYGKFDTTYLTEFKVDGETNNISSLVNKYILVDKNTPTSYDYLEKDRVIDIDLKLPVYTVKFVDDSGNKLRDDYIYPVKVDEIFKYAAPKISGYKIKSGGNLNVPYQTKNLEFTVVYEKDSTSPEKPGPDTNTGGPGPSIPDTSKKVIGKLNKEDHIEYIQGYPNVTVRPENNITREEVAAVFYRLLDKDYKQTIYSNSNKFTDVDGTRWSNKHISTLAKGDIIKGYEDGEFKHSQNITRGEVAALAARFDKLEEHKTNFSDIEGHWAEKYIGSAVKKGWIKGYPDGTFKPDQNITRAEFVTLVNNVLERKVKEENILKGIKEFEDLEKGKWYYLDMVEAINGHEYTKKDNNKTNEEKWIKLNQFNLDM